MQYEGFSTFVSRGHAKTLAVRDVMTVGNEHNRPVIAGYIDIGTYKVGAF